jgi:hypothetical protein
MSELYVLKDGRHVGPMSKAAIARGMAEGTIPRDVYVAPPGAKGWLHASQMPELLEALAEAMKSVPPTRGVSLTGTLMGHQSPMRSFTPAVAYAPPSSGKVPAAAPIDAKGESAGVLSARWPISEPISALTRAATPVLVESPAPEPVVVMEETGREAEAELEPPAPTWLGWWIFAAFAVATGVEAFLALSR